MKTFNEKIEENELISAFEKLENKKSSDLIKRCLECEQLIVFTEGETLDNLIDIALEKRRILIELIDRNEITIEIIAKNWGKKMGENEEN